MTHPNEPVEKPDEDKPDTEQDKPDTEAPEQEPVKVTESATFAVTEEPT